MGLTRADIQAIATATGRPVVAAWSGHDAGQMGTVVGVVMHHTGSAWGAATAPTLAIVRDGRSDLVNALSTYYIDRAGTIYLISEKICWHAGTGAWRGITDGNGHFLGIEAESDGVNWTDATVESYVRLVAEIVRFLGADPNAWAIRHAAWAPTRKVDFSGLNEADFRARVAAHLSGSPQEDDMNQGEHDALVMVAGLMVNVAPAIGRLEQAAWTQAARIDALTAIVQQLATRQGTPIDMAAVEATVQKGVADAIQAIETTVTVKPGP